MRDLSVPSYNNISFKGYDARRLQGFLMHTNIHKIAEELCVIGKKEDFKVIMWGPSENSGATLGSIWAQDDIGIVKNTFTLKSPSLVDRCRNYLHLQHNKTQKALQILHDALSGEKKLIQLENAIKFDKNNYIYQTADGTTEFIEKQNRKDAISNYYDILNKAHVAGGNYFIVKGKYGNDELLIGKDELSTISKKRLKSMFFTPKVTALPQMDFHLDLFIRPLDNQKILIADDNLMLESIDKAIKSAKTQINSLSTAKLFLNYPELRNILKKLTRLKKCFLKHISKNTYKTKEKVESVLQSAGFEVISVPGRLYKAINGDLLHDLNFMNANVLKNSQGDLVYITNHTELDDAIGLTPKYQQLLNFGFEREFTKALSPFVKKEHIYFVSGENNNLSRDLLKVNQGGIHCLCAEIPLNKKHKKK